jgi:hypothetical protein
MDLVLFSDDKEPHKEPTMQRTVARAAAVLAVLLALGAPAGAAGWKEYRSEDGRFSVLLPADPAVESATTDTDLGPVELHTVKCVTDRFLCVVTYYDVRLKTGQSAEAFLEANCDDFTRGANLLQKGDRRAVKVGEHAGREVTGETADGRAQLTARYYLVGTRVYVVMVGTSVDDAELPEVARYLDSFRLLA